MAVTHQFKDRVQLVTCLVSKFGSDGVSIIRAVRMIVLADIYALRTYGTILSKDEYFAVRNGLVASDTEIILEQSGDAENLRYVREFLRREAGVVYAVKEADSAHLSEWDVEAIDAVYDRFRGHTAQELIDMAHGYRAWSKHKEKLDSGKERMPVDVRDFFENDGELAVSPEVIAMSKEFYGTV